MLVTTLFMLAIGLPSLGGKHNSAPVPPNSDISYIESKISLPSEAPGPLPRYERYYAWTIDNGRKYIYAVYIFSDLLDKNKIDPNGIHIHAVTEAEIPNISNGGCGVITFYFNPRGDSTPSLYCNPVGPATTPTTTPP